MTALTPRLVLLLTLPPLLWAGNAVVGRMLVGSAPPLALNAVRWALALLILLPLGWRAIATAEARAQVWQRKGYLALLGGLGIGCYNALQYAALATTTPLNATLIVGSSPVWMLAIGYLAYRERPRAAQAWGALLSIAGVLVVLSRGDPALLAQVHFVRGDLMMLLAVFGWAVYSWLLARPPASMRGDARPDWDWAGFLLVQALFGVAWAVGAAGVEAAAGDAPFHGSAFLVLAMVYVAIFPSVIAYRCWGQGVAAGGPTLAAFFANLTPLFAALLSAALIGDLPRRYHALAFALIVAGIVVSSRR